MLPFSILHLSYEIALDQRSD